MMVLFGYNATTCAVNWTHERWLIRISHGMRRLALHDVGTCFKQWDGTADQKRMALYDVGPGRFDHLRANLDDVMCGVGVSGRDHAAIRVSG